MEGCVLILFHVHSNPPKTTMEQESTLPRPMRAPRARPNAIGVKSFLGTEGLTEAQLRTVLDTAKIFKKNLEQGIEIKSPAANKTVILLFFEASTRTRSSFDLAARRLKASTLTLTKQMSSVEKGETLVDTAKTIEAMRPDLLVLRHPSAGTAFQLDRSLHIPVVNAGDGFHEHPTQALLDVFTMEELKGSVKGLKVLLVGDIAHSRVARSDIYALKTLGADVSVCAPATLLPPKAESLGVKVFYDLDKAVKGQDVVIALRIQFERLGGAQIPSRAEYTRFYGVTSRVLKLCEPKVLIMAPGPVNRGLELTAEVADGSRSVILNQVENGVVVRMALIHLLMGGEVPR